MAEGFCDLSEIQQLSRAAASMARRMKKKPPRYLGVTKVYRHPEQAMELPFREEASWQEAIDHIAEERRSPERHRDELKKILSVALARGDGQWLLSPSDAWRLESVREGILHALESGDRGPLARALEDLGLAFRAEAVRHPGLLLVVKFLGHQDRPVKIFDRSFSLRPDGSVALSEKDVAALQKVLSGQLPFPKLAALLEEPAKAEAQAVERLSKFYELVDPFAREVLGQEYYTVADVYGKVLPSLKKEERELLLQEIRSLAVTTDDIAALTRQEFERALDEDFKQALADLQPRYRAIFQFLFDVFGRFRDFSREVGVFRPLFWLEQFIQDSVVKPWLFGVRGWSLGTYKEFRAYAQTWRKALELGISPETLRESGIVPRTAADRTLEEWGVSQLPHELSSAFERAFQNREILGYSAKESAIWRLPGMSILQQAQWGEQKGLLRDLLALLGLPARAYAEASAFLSLLARSQEMATRKAIFAAGVEQMMTLGGAEAFLRSAEQLFASHGATDLFPSFAERFRKANRRLPEDIARMVLDLAEDRPTLAAQTKRLWIQVVEEAIERGLELTRKVNYDFLDRRRIDDFLGAIFRYHFWASRNLPFYLEEFLRHYTLFKLWVRSLLSAERSAEEEGTPQRARPKLPVPLGPFDDLLFGKGARFYLDVWSLISVTSQIDPSAYSLDNRRGTVYDWARSLAASMGFSVNWDLAMAMAILGYDTRPSLPRLIPQTYILGGALGLEPFGFLGGPAASLREAVSGRLPGSRKIYARETLTGNPGLDRAVWLEIVAMAYWETGNPNHPRYVAAMANPDDPIFQEAFDRVRKNRFGEAVFNLFTPGIRGSAVLPEELLLRADADEARENAALLSPEARQRLLRIGDPSVWYLYVPGDAREAQIRSGFAAEDLGSVSPLLFVARFPWYLAYREWARGRPPGERSVSAYLEAVDQGEAPRPELLAELGFYDQYLLENSGWIPPRIDELRGKLESWRKEWPSS